MKKSVLMTFLLISILFIGCEYDESIQLKGQEEQDNIMLKARAAYPTPKIERYLTRAAVVKWIERMDQPGKVFYIYILSNAGTITHYFIGQYRPVSVGTFLTPTQRISRWLDGNPVTNAPSLDGTYYSEGASQQYFFFDAETDAYIELKGLNYIISDQPFDVEVPKINILTQ